MLVDILVTILYNEFVKKITSIYNLRCGRQVSFYADSFCPMRFLFGQK